MQNALPADAQRSLFWAYAASFGAIWGAIEATLGSFLHAIRLPFSGVFLASNGAALLIALRVLYPKPGVLLATGVICAAIKLSSPATMLLGPAIGILTEAIIVELLCLLLFGANRLSAPLAGALCALCAITQKVLTQILMYGAPIVDLYTELLQRGSQSLGLSRDHGISLVFGFAALIALIGGSIGALGLRAGRTAKAREQGAEDDAALAVQHALRSEGAGAEQRARARLASRARALLCLMYAICTLVLLTQTPRTAHPALLLALTLLCFFTAPQLLRACGRPRSWLLAALILLLLGGLLDKHAQGNWSWPGALLASTMLTRALSLVLCCQALLASLPAPKTRDAAWRSAAQAALLAVPVASAALQNSVKNARAAGIWAPHKLLSAILHEAVWLACCSVRARHTSAEDPL